ncbi:flagellar hook-length control protein FliK [Bacillus sp. V3B]|nr:flagellar hook-length control protein FliK [Bacillus sp. V3B]
MDGNEAIIALINILPNINMDQTTLKTDQNFASVAKSLKLFELLSDYKKPSMDQQKIEEFLQKTIEKLEVSLKENVSTTRSEFLKQVFTPVVKELNEQTFKNLQTDSNIKANQFLSATTQLNLSKNEINMQVLPATQAIKEVESEAAKQAVPPQAVKGVESEVAKQAMPPQAIKGVESEVAKQSLTSQQIVSRENEVNKQVVTNKKTNFVLNNLHPLQLTSQHTGKNTNSSMNQNNSFNFSNGGFLPVQQMSKTEQLTLLIDGSDKQVSTEKLIQQFESILSKSHLLKTGGTQKLFLKLNPEHLGALRVELIQKESVLVAKILTSTLTAKDLLESQLQSLKNAFSLQNIQVEKIDILQQMSGQERFINRDSQQQQEQKQQREQEEQKQQHDPQFGVSFEEALLNVEV